MKKLLLLSLSLSLIGCATTPLPEPYYAQLASQFAAASICGSKGFMPPETAAMAIRFTRNKLNEYTYDKTKMEERLNSTQNNLKMTREECNTMAVWAMGIQGNVTSNNTQNNVLRTTNCSTYFGITNCTTY